MKRNLPDRVGSLVEVGLETGEALDRLIALGVANSADEKWSPRTDFGPRVVEIFLDQFDLEFEEPTKPIKTKGWGDYVTPREAQIIRHVSKAVGGELEVRTRFYEFLGAAGANESFVAVDGRAVQVMDRVFGRTKPILVKHDYSNDKSRDNFQKAVKAVEAYGEDEAWSGHFAQMPGLREV